MPGYMECSCYNVLGGSLKVGDTDGYPLVWCIGRQLSYHQQGMTLCLETSAVNFIVGWKLLALCKKSSRPSRP